MSKKKSLVEQIFDGEIHVSEQITPMTVRIYERMGKNLRCRGIVCLFPYPCPAEDF